MTRNLIWLIGGPAMFCGGIKMRSDEEFKGAAFTIKL
jgi:hypothetical protein